MFGQKIMKTALFVIALAASSVVAADTNVQPKVIFRIATTRDAFGTNAAPLHLVYTFLNVGPVPFSVSPNRIENQHTVKFIVKRSRAEFPQGIPEEISSYIADYLHLDKAEVVTVAPGDCYVYKDSYFQDFRTLLDLVSREERHDAHRGSYYIKAYFDGRYWPIPEDAEPKGAPLFRGRLESNTIEISVDQTKE